MDEAMGATLMALEQFAVVFDRRRGALFLGGFWIDRGDFDEVVVEGLSFGEAVAVVLGVLEAEVDGGVRGDDGADRGCEEVGGGVAEDFDKLVAVSDGELDAEVF